MADKYKLVEIKLPEETIALIETIEKDVEKFIAGAVDIVLQQTLMEREAQSCRYSKFQPDDFDEIEDNNWKEF